jgi:glycerol-3-phosphate dehydrogenase
MSTLYDLIVVGGGCNGTGIARDAAMRGLSVLLVEKDDFSAGTTGASSGMIHGGPRYLMYEVGTTKKACRDAGYIRKIAPHLCFRIPFIVPIKQEGRSKWRSWFEMEVTETFFEVYDRFSKLKGGEKHTRLTPEEVRQIEPSIPNNIRGAITFDEWGIDTQRLCVANALAAEEYGAIIRNHTEVTTLIKEAERVQGIETRHTITGARQTFRAKIIFNTTGPWSPQFAAMAGCEIKLRPGKGIHLVLDRRLCNAAVVSKCIDGRQIFVNPHENTTLVGTTDDDFFGDLDDIPVTEDEIEYLLEGMESVFPDVRQARIVTTWRGVRPTIYGRDCYEDALSRDHEIIDHEKKEGVKGFLSMIGGKLASFREMSEEATDLIVKKLGVHAECQTHLVPLPGGETEASVEALSKEFGVDPFVVRRLVYRQGDRARKVLETTRSCPRDKTVVCPCEPVMNAELRYTQKNEWAQTFQDLSRRTRVGVGPCQGALCSLPTVACLAEEKAWSAEQILQSLKSNLDTQWRARFPVLKGDQLAQEEINQALFKGTLSLKHLKVSKKTLDDSGNKREEEKKAS